VKAALLVVGALALAVGAGAAATATGLVTPPWTAAAATESPAPDAATPEVQTASVEQRSMETAAELDGTLGYEGSFAVGAGSTGTVTRVPDAGDVIERGEVLYELDGTVRPRLLYGERPLWRPMGPGMGDGADVLQLERNLEALGYAPKKLDVDRDWDRHTTRAVKRWQKAIGVKRDGTLDGADMAFLPGAVRVAGVAAEPGTSVGPGTPVLDATSAGRVVTLDLSASRQDLVAPGQAVTVELPDGTLAAGTVREVGRVASTAQDGTTTVPVTVDVDDPSALPALDAAPVAVHVVTERREDVLAVPVNALVALLEGGYAVEVVGDDDTRRYVGVETGLFQDGMVEVSGDGLAAGDTVVTAR
jgi:peptidoglycan hydrolase-like protein with peptidoglycan-binding domain